MTLLLILLHCFLYKQARNYEVLIFCLLNKTVKPTDFLLFNLKHYCSCVVCFFFSLAKHRPDWIFCQTNLFYSTYQEKVWKQRLRFERKAHAQGLQLSLRLNSTLQGEGRNRTYGIHFWLPKNTLKSQTVVLSLAGLFWKAEWWTETGTQWLSVTAVPFPLQHRQPSFSRTAVIYGHTPPGTAAPWKHREAKQDTWRAAQWHRGHGYRTASSQTAPPSPRDMGTQPSHQSYTVWYETRQFRCFLSLTVQKEGCLLRTKRMWWQALAQVDAS